MRSVRRILTVAVLPIVLGLLAAMLVAGPAQAANAGCNSNTTVGENIGSYTPPGSTLTRVVYAKVCVAYDTNSVRNSTGIHCRTSNGGPCDIRAEVLQAKEDLYDYNGGYIRTGTNNWLHDSGSSYQADWGWLGTDWTGCCGWPIDTAYKFQSNDFTIRVRFGAETNHPLHDFGNAFSFKVSLT